MPELARPLLVAVSDRRRLQMPIDRWARVVLASGVDLIQLREKDLSEAGLRQIAQQLLAAVEPEQLQINGFPKLARELGCGLHLPEASLLTGAPPRPFSRAIHGADGISVEEEPDFLIAGHIFETSSKIGQPARGTNWLSALAAISPYPVVAIGGIDASNAAAVLRAGAAGIAVIGALSGPDNPHEQARHLRAVLDQEWRRG